MYLYVESNLTLKMLDFQSSGLLFGTFYTLSLVSVCFNISSHVGRIPFPMVPRDCSPRLEYRRLQSESTPLQ